MTCSPNESRQTQPTPPMWPWVRAFVDHYGFPPDFWSVRGATALCERGGISRLVQGLVDAGTDYALGAQVAPPAPEAIADRIVEALVRDPKPISHRRLRHIVIATLTGQPIDTGHPVEPAHPAP